MSAPAAIAIRDAAPTDMTRVQEIYAHHVLEGLASFEEVAPDLAEIGRRFEAVLARGDPFRVALQGGRVQGYAYAGPYRTRAAYRHTIENSIYVDPATLGRGIGRLLLEDLVGRCAALGYRQMVAVIGDSANAASIRLHANQGFAMIGTLPALGFKHGRWVDQVIMQRPLGDGDTTLP